MFPLIVGEELVGFMALTKPGGDETLTWEDLDLLKTMGPPDRQLPQASSAGRAISGRSSIRYLQQAGRIHHSRPE